MASKTGRDDALCLALARGLSVRAAAKASGYSERQAHRKMDDPGFRQRVNETRGAIVGRAVGILTAAGTEAARTLRKLLKAESERVRLAAARGILELGPKLRESTDLTERIEDLERITVVEDGGWYHNDAHARAAGVSAPHKPGQCNRGAAI